MGLESIEIIGCLLLGWAAWSLSHYIGHRMWHKNILDGKLGVATHGEHEHHNVYDTRPHDKSRDPYLAFVSFPYPFILPAVALASVGFGYLFGMWPGLLFFGAAFVSMTLDDQAHRRIHLKSDLGPLLRRFQRFHDIHHETHSKNFAFVSGIPWDLLFFTYNYSAKSESNGNEVKENSDRVA